MRGFRSGIIVLISTPQPLPDQYCIWILTEGHWYNISCREMKCKHRRRRNQRKFQTFTDALLSRAERCSTSPGPSCLPLPLMAYLFPIHPPPRPPFFLHFLYTANVNSFSVKYMLNWGMCSRDNIGKFDLVVEFYFFCKGLLQFLLSCCNYVPFILCYSN